MKTPDTITAKVREFREKKATLLDWRPKEPLEIESSDVSQFGQQYSDGQSVWTVVDWRNIETFLEQALLDIRRETAEEISARFKAMQERYPEFCLDVFYDSDMDFMFIKTTEYERIKPS